MKVDIYIYTHTHTHTAFGYSDNEIPFSKLKYLWLSYLLSRFKKRKVIHFHIIGFEIVE